MFRSSVPPLCSACFGATSSPRVVSSGAVQLYQSEFFVLSIALSLNENGVFFDLLEDLPAYALLSTEICFLIRDLLTPPLPASVGDHVDVDVDLGLGQRGPAGGQPALARLGLAAAPRTAGSRRRSGCWGRRRRGRCRRGPARPRAWSGTASGRRCDRGRRLRGGVARRRARHGEGRGGQGEGGGGDARHPPGVGSAGAGSSGPRPRRGSERPPSRPRWRAVATVDGGGTRSASPPESRP